MADDPNRDLLPVKEYDPSKGLGRKMSKSDVIDNHYKTNLQLHYMDKPNEQELENRYSSVSDKPNEQERENHYRSVVDETDRLRKLCAAQEDKIKR